MPRIYDNNNDPLDFCQDCFDPDAYPDANGIDSEHPPYCDTEYECEDCGNPLICKDDYESSNKVFEACCVDKLKQAREDRW